MQMVELERKLKTKKMRKCKLHGQGHGHHKPCVKPCDVTGNFENPEPIHG